MELQSLVSCTRMLLVICEAIEHPVEKVIMAGDSECSLAAILNPGSLLKPYFQNRVSEFHENVKKLASLVDEVEPVWWIEGKLNPADLGTRGHATAADISSGSIWQTGPSFLKMPRVE